MKGIRRPHRVVLIALVSVPAFAVGCPDTDVTRSGHDAIYSAGFAGLNAQQVVGEALFGFDLEEDVFVVQVSVTGVAPGIPHLLAVHEALQCPPLAADLNEDGFIDVTEAMAFSGRFLLPLDDDLLDQRSGNPPVAHSAGRIFYDLDVSYSGLLAELRTQDPEPDPIFARLPPGGELDLHQRSVLLYGVTPETPLPSTVAALPGMTRQESLPIGCGTIIQLR